MNTRRGFLQGVAALVLAAPLSRAMRGADALATLGHSVPATTLTVSGGHFYVGDLIKIQGTGETMRVTSVRSTDGRLELGVQRGVGARTPAPTQRGDEVLAIAGFTAPQGDAKDPFPRVGRIA